MYGCLCKGVGSFSYKLALPKIYDALYHSSFSFLYNCVNIQTKEGAGKMKRIMIAFVILLVVIGCSPKEEAVSKVPSPSENEKALLEENQQLKAILEQRPTVTVTDLRETMNLSMRFMQAMVDKDYDFLESNSDSSVVINKDSNSFSFKDSHEQNFLSTIDYKKLEYRFHDANDDGIIVGFAQENVELIFTFKQEGSDYLLISYLTN
jgi:hypothetical protein